MCNFEKSIENIANIDNKVNIIIDYYKSKTETDYDDKKTVVSIINEIRNDLLDFYPHCETIVKLTEKCQP